MKKTKEPKVKKEKKKKEKKKKGDSKQTASQPKVGSPTPLANSPGSPKQPPSQVVGKADDKKPGARIDKSEIDSLDSLEALDT